MNDIGAKVVDGLLAFMELKESWMSFYEKLGLIGLAETLNSEDAFVDIVGLKEDENLKDLNILFMPPVEVQKQYLENLKNACETSDRKIWLSPWTVEKYFSNITFLNRPKGKPHLFLTENEKEAPEETLNGSPVVLRQSFKDQGRVGMNLFEYFIFHRSYIQEHSSEKKISCPDVHYAVWLLDSELPDGKPLITETESAKGYKMKVWALPVGYSEYNAQKARSGIVIPL